MKKTLPPSDIFKYLLPKEMSEYFIVSSIKEQNGQLTIVLEEKNLPPPEYEGKRLESKGFYPPRKLEDFPIREYKVYLEVRRRKWLELESGKIVSRDWELTAKGTSYTKEFGVFLKEMVRYFPGKR